MPRAWKHGEYTNKYFSLKSQPSQKAIDHRAAEAQQRQMNSRTGMFRMLARDISLFLPNLGWEGVTLNGKKIIPHHFWTCSSSSSGQRTLVSHSSLTVLRWERLGSFPYGQSMLCIIFVLAVFGEATSVPAKESPAGWELLHIFPHILQSAPHRLGVPRCFLPGGVALVVCSGVQYLI